MSPDPVLPSRRRSRRGLVPAVLACLAAVAFVGPARAEFVADSTALIRGTPGTSGPGFFTGSVAVDNVSTTQAVIQVSLTNTSPPANGGYITGFAFNEPNSPTTRPNVSTVTSFTQSYNPAGTGAPNNMTLIGGPGYQNSISGSPYGSFDIGAAVGGSLLGGGAPQPGIEAGQTGTFQFTVSGTNLDKLTAQLIMNTLSTGGGGGQVPFVVRFRGFEDGDSDKVVAGEVVNPPTTPPTTPIPAPPGAVLGLLGAGGFLLRGLRRRA